MIAFAGSLALDRGLPAVTLSIFRDVSWNSPYYRRIGFVDVAEADGGEQVRRIRTQERERGLDSWPRVVMTRDVLRDGPVPRITEPPGHRS